MTPREEVRRALTICVVVVFQTAVQCAILLTVALGVALEVARCAWLWSLLALCLVACSHGGPKERNRCGWRFSSRDETVHRGTQCFGGATPVPVVGEFEVIYGDEPPLQVEAVEIEQDDTVALRGTVWLRSDQSRRRWLRARGHRGRYWWAKCRETVWGYSEAKLAITPATGAIPQPGDDLAKLYSEEKSWRDEHLVVERIERDGSDELGGPGDGRFGDGHGILWITPESGRAWWAERGPKP